MKILIVEDDFASRKLLEKLLQPLGEVLSAADGDEAVDLFDQEIDKKAYFDLVCLDIMLPGRSGQEVLKHIRNKEYSHEIYGLDGVKIIMTTALSDSPHVLEAFRHQCEAYITKPIKKAELFEEIEKLGLSTSPLS